MVSSFMKKLEKIFPDVLSTFFILIVSFAFSLTARSQFLVTNTAQTDSSVFQYVARVIVNGGVPYRDTFDHKGPLLYVLNALAVYVSPEIGLWAVEFVCLLLSFGLMYRLACLFCGKISSLFVVLAIIPMLNRCFEGGNLTEEYALPFITGALYIFADYFVNHKITKFRLIICGSCFGAVLMLRINMIAVWFVMCIGVLFLCLWNKEYKSIGSFLVLFLLGAFIVIFPFILWLAVSGALQNFWNDYILFNFMYSSDEERANVYSKILAFSKFFHMVPIIISAGVLLVSLTKKKSLFDVLCLASLIVTLVLICISGQTYLHYGMNLIPILIIPFAYIGKSCDEFWNNGQLASVFIVICLLSQFVFPTWSAIFDNAVTSIENHGTETVSPDVERISLWIQSCTTPDDSVIVCGNWCEIYNRSGRFASSRYSYQTPICQISSDMKNDFLEEIHENQPAVIVLPHNFFARDEVIEFAEKNSYSKVTVDGVSEKFFLYQRTVGG